jgi:hypothetical protein
MVDEKSVTDVIGNITREEEVLGFWRCCPRGTPKHQKTHKVQNLLAHYDGGHGEAGGHV